MGKQLDAIDDDLAAWIADQKVFFVATAPLATDGLINCSPKGMDSLRVLNSRQVAYLDLTGSGIETIAHLRENGRILIMLCAFAGPPRIVRLHGTGTTVLPVDHDWSELKDLFPEYAGVRAIIRVDVERVSTSCGYSVPRFQFVEDRDTLVKWAEKKGPEGIAKYQHQKNAKSIDGLPGLDPVR